MIEVMLISLLTFVASAVGTVTGFGTSTIMVPALLFCYPMPQVLLLVGIVHLAGNLWRMLFFPSGLRWHVLLWFGVPSVLAGYLGATLTTAVDETLLQRILGAVLLLYAVFLYFHASWKIPASTPTAVAGGLASGFMAGMFGVGGAVRAAFLRAFELPKEAYIFTAAAIATVTDSTRLITYTLEQINLPPLLWYGMIVFLPLSLLGSWIGKHVVNRLSESAFRMVVTAFLALAGIKFLLFPG
jgi:uncharacterized membrane protein YfcA